MREKVLLLDLDILPVFARMPTAIFLHELWLLK